MARVLVVDDDVNVRQTLSLVLRRSGHEVEEAEDGTAAIHKATRRSYDAAVVDYQMPPPDGLELLFQLRDIQPRCVRILMSGALELPVVINAVNRGEVSRVVQKPFARQAILNTLEEALTARARLEDLCVGARNDGFDVQRRHLEECLLDEVLTVALQPIVAANDNSVQGYEALLRSSHGQLDNAACVIAAAEAHDMLGRVADVVARCVARWFARLPPGIDVFINVHPAELSDVESVRRRFDALREWSDRIVLEITERSYVLKLDSWRTALDSLTRDGFRIAVDDLGAGYNSLSVLAELQPAFMKVDMSIVRHIEHDERKQRLVELLCRFAGATQTKLIVEGIETEEEASVVKRIGADFLQGYLFGKPSMTPALAQTHAIA